MTKAQTKKLKEMPKLLKAIKKKCLDCSAYSIYELKNCVCIDCPLFPYRNGVIEKKKNFTRGKSQVGSKNANIGGLQNNG